MHGSQREYCGSVPPHKGIFETRDDATMSLHWQTGSFTTGTFFSDVVTIILEKIHIYVYIYLYEYISRLYMSAKLLHLCPTLCDL